MDALKLKRKVVRTAFTRLFNEVNEAVNQKVVNISEDINCLATFQMLSEKHNELLNLNEDILSNLLNVDNVKIEDITTETEKADSYVYQFKKISLLFNRNDSTTPDDADSQSIISIAKRKFKLPPLELKKFGGEIKDWLPFWGQFAKIHEDPDLDETDKFQYLAQCTVPNSRARELIESFPQSSGNYYKAIECLKSRFGQDDLLVEYYVRELLKLTLAFNVQNNHTKLSTIYDRIETQLRSLETLGVTTDKYAAMLFPLVESCLTEEVLRTWQRSGRSLPVKEGETKESRLDSLMKFLKNEVESEERIELAMQGFSLKEHTKNAKPKKELPTAAGLFAGNRNGFVSLKCAFCEKGNHESKDCRFARNLDLNERMVRLKKGGCCFKCLKSGHISKKCHVRLSCEHCQRKHCLIMCPDIQNKSSSNSSTEPLTDRKDEHLNSLANPTCSANVLLQTLVVLLRGENKDFAVRAVIDTGSQKSYITKEAAEKMKYPAIKETALKHVLFGGVESQQNHFEYKIFVSDFEKKYYCTFNVLDQEKICSEIPQTKTSFCSKELKDNGICLADQEYFKYCSSPTIHLLIGADVAGKLMTGNIINLSCGLTAIETSLGWTIMGKSPLTEQATSKADSMIVTNLFVKEFAISDLWKLEAIGINDPCVSKKKEEIHQDTLEYFRSTVTVDEDDRYEVALPWVLESSRLPDHREMAEKRLASTYKKLVDLQKVEAYQEVFDQWISGGIIEEVKTEDEENVHYLPHRPVIKESSATTKIRPVYDASAHLKGTPSLNACLETGPNLIEMVPTLLNRFRKFPVGITSDIEKAFLQIGIRESDRDYLRFLWKTKDDDLKIYRHKRVVFGITCSPFLLAATLNHHLEKAPENLSETAQMLKSSFYVDNCVCSLKSADQANKFVIESRVLMCARKFNLREWRSNAPIAAIEQPDEEVVPLLGLSWNLKEDTLSCNIHSPKEEQKVLTKRGLLSLAQSIFDPLGITSPVTIIPKFILQETWSLGLKWDDDIPEDLANRFLKWLKKIQLLSNVKIPRWMGIGQDGEEDMSLHIFCDASSQAFATVIFLRVEVNHQVFVQFVQSRARVSPLKNLTIPRLELLSCCIGARLSANVVKDLQLTNLKIFYWSDSMTALCWIKRDAQWGTFVWNRVKEIPTQHTYVL